MTTNNIHINPYRICHIIITPMSGVVTQHDQRAFGAHYTWADSTEYVKTPFGCREDAVAWLTSFSKRLNKRYACRIITDKQFGMRKQGQPWPFTAKQNEDVYYIG